MTFEVVVRPAVVPNIRPAPAQPSSPAPGDSSQGMVTIHGASGRYLELPYSVSFSSSQPHFKEKKRRVDQVRIYQKDDNGKINKDNFVDVDSANKVWMDSKSSRYLPHTEIDRPQVDTVVNAYRYT